jgi:hypothetical protein
MEVNGQLHGTTALYSGEINPIQIYMGFVGPMASMNSRKKEIFLAAARNRKQALQIEFRPYTD